jgi:hypothetical protein
VSSDKEKQRGYRVQNAMKRIDLANVKSLKRWAVIKLLKMEPLARRVRFEGRCGVGRCRSDLSMSYQLEELDKPGRTNSRGDAEEYCGYFCPSCGFSNAGSRPIFRRRNAMVIADDEMKAAQAYIDALRNRQILSDKKFVDYHHDDKRK